MSLFDKRSVYERGTSVVSQIDEYRCKSTLVSRNITVLGRRTSIRLEPEMWAALYDIARREGTSIHNICSLVELRKVKESTLTAAIRVFLLLYYRAASTEDGHNRARHGNFDVMKSRVKVTDEMLGSSQRLARAGALS
ncbi:MAG TPA: ribbon-helix-helix domain-containing protein [Alphaproteobacteria bacterium]|nr:ribbon-helix-helix domain-containing protein [Alphaproteobacteria bacterium]